MYTDVKMCLSSCARVCLCVYVYVWVSVCSCPHEHVFEHVCQRICIGAHVRALVCVNIYTSICVQANISLSVYIWETMCIYVQVVMVVVVVVDERENYSALGTGAMTNHPPIFKLNTFKTSIISLPWCLLTFS